MSWRAGRRARRSEPAVQLAPLIDMTFLLLIFFMVSTSFVRDRALSIARPAARSASPAALTAVRVALDQAGRIYVDGQPTAPWLLQSRVRELVAAAHGAGVLVVADRRVDAGRLVEVVDACRLAGATEVAVATVPAAPGAGSGSAP